MRFIAHLMNGGFFFIVSIVAFNCGGGQINQDEAHICPKELLLWQRQASPNQVLALR